MNENETKKTETKKCSSDFRTFLIALLTSIIVIAVYHFAIGICSICSGDYGCRKMTPPATADYVLVPVYALPQPCHSMGPGKCHFGKKHQAWRGHRFNKCGMQPCHFRGPQDGRPCHLRGPQDGRPCQFRGPQNEPPCQFRGPKDEGMKPGKAAPGKPSPKTAQGKPVPPAKPAPAAK